MGADPLSAYGGSWRERYLGAFSIYIDDSGSAPEHKFAIAAGIVFPAKRIAAFEREWRTFLKREGMPELHASECVARNPHSPFADWDDHRVERALMRAQAIIFKFSVKAFSVGIHKQDYDEVMPQEMRLGMSRSHYVWAVSSLLGLGYDWATFAQVAPMEYVFDNVPKLEKRDIEESIEYSEAVYADHFSGHYSFRSRKEVAGLQAADLFAWVCYQAGRRTRFDIPMNAIAEKLWNYFRFRNRGEWSTVQSLSREGLEMWVKKAYGGPEDLRWREYKQRQTEARMPSRKKKVTPGV
ncbi:MAG: DUF3800 domain-containing protein [Candidatus Sulfotelmatobacter sp.]